MSNEPDGDVSHLLQLLQLEESVDNNGEVFISKENLLNISRDLNVSSEELDIIFSALDTDNDGLIKASDLKLGLSRSWNRSADGEDRHGFTTAMIPPEVELLCSDRQEQVCDLYQKLHASDHPELLDQFETIVLGVIRDIRQGQLENERLEKSFKRDKDQHERHLRQLEDEMEIQMQKMEERIREQEQHKAEAAKAEIQEQVESEVCMLKQNLQKLQQEGVGTWSKEQEEQLSSLKNKLEQITYENRQLKNDLTDAKTNLALVRSEMSSVKQQLKESTHELERERETVVDYIKEQDSLTRQLHLLHDANKRLHDTNDDLREALDSERLSPRRHSSSSAAGVRITSYSRDWAGSGYVSRPRERKGSILSDYIQSGPASLRPSSPTMSMTSSMMEDPFMTESKPRLNRTPSPRLIKAHPLHRKDSCDDDRDSVLEDMDSGHSTLRDLNELDTEAEAQHIDEDAVRQSLNRRQRRMKTGYIEEEEEPDSHDEMETETESQLDLDPAQTTMYHVLEKRRLGSAGSRSSSRSSRSLPRDGRDSPNSYRGNRRHAGTVAHEIVTKKSTPERMYKVVLAGDAAVGKSSFIMRLCKGKFVSNISSTLGVDFQTKVIETEGNSVALQLWDTAGQERFRSIAKSYFRRADGVLLLYDCTYERSFLSVREWMEAIEDGAQKKIPIMMCANKTDLRSEMQQQGRRVVNYEDGQRLAREFEALFIETSAKDGSHIMEAIIELTRLLRANEDLEVKTVGLQLHDRKQETKSGCCR